MSDADEGVEIAGSGAERDYRAVGLALAFVVAAVLATALVPASEAVGLGGPPAESLVPVPGGTDNSSGSGGGSAGGGGGSEFGALDVGEEQSVGGSVGAEDGNAFRSQDTEVHFQVSSEEASYWRTGAYDTYEGDGWSRSAPSDVRAPVDGRQVNYRVELARPARSAPTVWRPTSIDRTDGLELTGSGLARADEGLSAGDSYAGVSRKPPRDPSVLSASGRDYPTELERRYTRLPADTAVSLQPFTNNITEDADNPYETAVRIEEWLESNKEYSLNVSEPAGQEDVARDFVLQMDAGYCEYFATAMTAMLRSQEIPARYVVGYSTGQQVGADTYRVRAMNAHAWVEVYFEDVGWVRFDPTPGAARLQQEQQSYQDSGLPGTYTPQESGSPNETFSPETDDGSPIDGQSPDGPVSTPSPGDDSGTPTPSGPDDDEGGGYSVSLNRTAVPGGAVEVSVTAGAQPVVGAEVSFNGDPVGRTGRDGTVVATVPYTSNLSVTVSGGRTVASDVSALGAPALDGRPSAIPTPDAEQLLGQDTSDNATRTFEVETTATLSVSGDVRTGSTVVVTATVDSVPVPDATVSLDGEQVGRTDSGGRTSVTLPESPGNVTIRVARDPVGGEQTLRLRGLDVTAEPAWPLPVAGTSVDVTARLGNESVAGVPVRVGGGRVGETGVDGTVTARLPFESSVPVVVSTGGQTARTTVSNPLANAAGVVIVVVSAIVGGAVVATRQSIRPRALLGQVPARLRGGMRFLVRAFVGLALAVGRAVEHLWGLVAGRQSVADVVVAFQAWVASVVDRLRGGRDAAATDDPQSVDGHSDQRGEAHLTVREAWGRFLGYVSLRRAWTKTPGQIADHAVSSDGLPAEAVATLRDEFRAVEYGPRSPDDSVPAVEAAIAQIEAAVDAPTDRDGETATPDDGREADA